MTKATRASLEVIDKGAATGAHPAPLLFVFKPPLTRRGLFSAGTPQAVVDACAARLEPESMRASFFDTAFRLPKPSKVSAPMLVLGGADDGTITNDDVRAISPRVSDRSGAVPGYGAQHDARAGLAGGCSTNRELAGRTGSLAEAAGDPAVDLTHRHGQRFTGEDHVIGAGNLDAGAVGIARGSAACQPGGHDLVALRPDHEHRSGDSCVVDLGRPRVVEPRDRPLVT
jgi:hypothetical protein